MAIEDDDTDDSWDYTDEELDALSDVEREALTIDEPETEEEAVTEEVQEPETADVVANTPKLSIEEELKAISAEIEKLGSDMEDGEIAFSEYNKLLHALVSKQTRLEVNAEHQRQEAIREQANWNKAQEYFFSRPENVDLKNKPRIYNALSAEVSALATSGDAQGKSYSWLLETAKKNVYEEFGLSVEAKQPIQPTKSKRAIDNTVLPKTLGNIPQAQANDTGSEFAHLDNMTLVQRERALAGMSEDAVERYLRSA